jgi:hypothetical protein
MHLLAIIPPIPPMLKHFMGDHKVDERDSRQ